MLAFFASGLNEKFIPNNTALDKVNTAGYEKLHTTKEEINRLEEIMTEADKVYYLCQYPADDLSGAELYNASVLYYLDGRISNYLQSPWKFTSTGCNIRLEEFDLSIADFPALLAQGGYTYVWVHTTNPYLTRELPLVLDCGDVADGYLYKVIYENGAGSASGVCGGACRKHSRSKWVNTIRTLYQKYKELINYLIVGGLTTVVSLGVYYGCVLTFLNPEVPVQLQAANVLSWIAAVTFAYFTNRKYVFESKNENRLQEAAAFYGSRVTTLLLDMFCMFLMVTLIGWNDKVAKLVVQVLVTVANYILSKFLVFRKK